MTGPVPAKHEVVRAVRAERRATLALLAGLSPDQWDAPTALPGWRVREVVAHLASLDRAAVTGAILPVLFSSIERLERWNDRQVPRWAGRSPTELLLALERWGRRFARLAASIPGPVYCLPLPTPWGRAPGGLLVLSRAYDEWVHRQDIRRALGHPDQEVDLAPACEFLLAAVGVQVPRRLGGLEGRVVVALRDAPVPEWGYDLTTGVAGPRPGGPADARIAAPAPAFIMAAAGRDSFQDLERTGLLEVRGREDLARAFLAQVRIV